MKYLLPALLALSASLQAAVLSYPTPSGETLATDYQVVVNRIGVDVYSARVLDPPFAGKQYDYGGPYCFANFDLDGPAQILVTSKRSLSNAVIRPASAAAKLRIMNEHSAVISIGGPGKLSFEPDGKKGPLLLFANPVEAQPRLGTPGVVYFGPGTHKPTLIELTNNQTLYLAGGSVVKAGIVAQGENIRICGRGILDSSDWEWRKGPTPHVISIRGTNVEVSGITIRGASHWTVVPRDSRNVTIRNIKICGGRVQNDDGINPCNSQDVLITNCFIRTDDDCVAMKGMKTSGGNVQNVTVEDCILWCDRARIFLLGHESRAPFMRDITLRNLDIVHYTMTPFLFEPGEEMRLENVKIEDIRIHGEGQNELLRLKPVVNQYMQTKVPRHVADVTFNNVTVSGKPGPYRVQLSGADEQHQVKNITLKNIQILGTKLTRDSDRLQVGNFVDKVEVR